MKKYIATVCAFFLAIGSILAQTNTYKKDSTLIREIYTEVLSNGEIYGNLRSLTKGIGHRLSGSYQAERAMHWGADLFRKYGADSVSVSN